MTISCEYCGTGLRDDGETTDTGQTHYAAQCREYVAISRNAYRKEAAEFGGMLNHLAQAVLASPTADTRCITAANAALKRLSGYVARCNEPTGENTACHHVKGHAGPHMPGAPDEAPAISASADDGPREGGEDA